MKNSFVLASLLLVMNLFAADIDTAKSKLKWKGTKVTGEHLGEVPFKSGSLKMNEAGALTGGEFEVSVEKLTVTDLAGSMKEKLEGHLKNADFFNVGDHPTSKLVITKAEKGKLTGDLTIKGITKSITFPYTVAGNTFKGKLKFDRTKYGIKYGSGSFFENLGDKAISNDVELDFEIVVKK
ncbi:YceI family protein [Bacteriovoracaceae bacterium]|nr:YceI family protein [Bacteriovoracaceae bacterium]